MCVFPVSLVWTCAHLNNYNGSIWELVPHYRTTGESPCKGHSENTIASTHFTPFLFRYFFSNAIHYLDYAQKTHNRGRTKFPDEIWEIKTHIKKKGEQKGVTQNWWLLVSNSMKFLPHLALGLKEQLILRYKIYLRHDIPVLWGTHGRGTLVKCNEIQTWLAAKWVIWARSNGITNKLRFLWQILLRDKQHPSDIPICEQMQQKTREKKSISRHLNFRKKLKVECCLAFPS